MSKPDFSIANLAGKAGGAVAKVLTPKLENMTIEAKVRFARAVMKQRGLEAFKGDMVRGFSEEFAEKVKKNPALTEDDLTGEYLASEVWVKWWSELGFNKENLRALAREAIDNKVIAPEVAGTAATAPRNFPRKQRCPTCGKGCKREGLEVRHGVIVGCRYRCPKHGALIMGVH